MTYSLKSSKYKGVINMENEKMKYSSYLNGELILTSNSIRECVEIITNHIPNHEFDGWNNFFRINHGHLVNNEEISIAWSSRIIDNRK